MNMYQKRKVRQEKRENNNEEKNRQIAPISWYNPTYVNHSQTFINKDFFLHLFLHFTAKK